MMSSSHPPVQSSYHPAENQYNAYRGARSDQVDHRERQKPFSSPSAVALKCKIVLAVLCETSIGQRVAVVGNASTIGAWEIARPLLLSTDERAYPTWSCQFYVDEREGNGTLEYKFIKLTSRPDGKLEVEWEDIGENRKIDVTHRVSVVVEAAFSEPGKRKETFVQR